MRGVFLLGASFALGACSLFLADDFSGQPAPDPDAGAATTAFDARAEST